MADPSIRRRLEQYAAADEPLIRASNGLALIVAANQPFYPLYVWWVTGEATPLLAFTFVSTPFLVATPIASRHFPRIGRLWLPASGALNTFFCAYVFGEASGVELFLAPCLVIALLSCGVSQRRDLGIYIVGVFCGFVLRHGRYGAPLYQRRAGSICRSSVAQSLELGGPERHCRMAALSRAVGGRRRRPLTLAAK